MGLLERVAEDRDQRAERSEERVIGGVPWRPWDNPFVSFGSGGPIHPSRSFYGTDEALRLVPVYAAVRLIAEYISSLPLKTYLKDPSTGKQRRWHGPTIFDDPAPETNVMDWLYQCLTSLLLHGNAWGFILGRDGFGYPTQIVWMPPEMVTVIDDEIQPFNPLRSRVYFYGRLMQREEYFHIKAFSIPGRTEAISPLRAFALTILNGLEATRYGTDWFKAGGFPPGTFKNNAIEIDPAQAAEIRASLNNAIRRREPLVYGTDWDYHPVTVPPSEAQFIEAMQMNATQIAAVYGLPPDRVGGKRGDSLTYSTVEQGALQIIEALRPWMVRLETAFFSIIPQNRIVRFNPDALLKTDLQTKAGIYRVWRDIGYESIDSMRERDDLEPLPNGVGADNIPLDAVVGMSRSTRAIPNSLLPQVTLEARLALEYLQALQAGLEPPGLNPAATIPQGDNAKLAPPPVNVPGAIGASPGGVQGHLTSQQVSQGPSGSPSPGARPLSTSDGTAGTNSFGGFIPPNPEAFLAKIVAAVRSELAEHAPMNTSAQRGPEYCGPWIEEGRRVRTDLRCYIDIVAEAAGWPEGQDPPLDLIRSAKTLGEQLFGIEERDPREPVLDKHQAAALISVLRAQAAPTNGFRALAMLNGHAHNGNGRH